MSTSPLYVWFDAEFTDLDPERSHLLQVAMVLTDVHLNRLAPAEQDLCVDVRLPDEAAISPWVAEHLPDLVGRCHCESALPVEEVDRLLATRLQEIGGPNPKSIGDRPVLAGNSIHADRGVIRKHLPLFEECLHYRMLDVSTIKLIWNDSKVGPVFEKDTEHIATYFEGARLQGGAHDAYYDVQGSIAELNFYIREGLLPSPGGRST